MLMASLGLYRLPPCHSRFLTPKSTLGCSRSIPQIQSPLPPPPPRSFAHSSLPLQSSRDTWTQQDQPTIVLDALYLPTKPLSHIQQRLDGPIFDHFHLHLHWPSLDSRSIPLFKFRSIIPFLGTWSRPQINKLTLNLFVPPLRRLP